MSGPLSLSGAELDGDCLVGRIYCDESGGRRFFVVAGVIVHSETQWQPLEEHLGVMVQHYIAEADRPGFYFHATDIFNGSGLFKDSGKYPLALRCEILRELLSIPSRFQLPVVCGFIRKVEQETPSNLTTQQRREADAEDHAITFCRCAIAAEKFMRENSPPKELSELIVEDNTNTRASVEIMGKFLRSRHPSLSENQARTTEDLQLGRDFLPLRKISESPSWKSKKGARLLQLADVCAFAIRCFLEERRDIEQFVLAFVPLGPERIADLGKVRANAGGMLTIRSWA